MSWVHAGEAAAITKARRVVLDVDGRQVLVLAHDGDFYAFDNICVHRQRELAKGVVLNGKLVCPGHQWAFALDSGWEAIKECYQPVYSVRVTDGVVEVDVTADAPAHAAVDVAAEPAGDSSAGA